MKDSKPQYRASKIERELRGAKWVTFQAALEDRGNTIDDLHKLARSLGCKCGRSGVARLRNKHRASLLSSLRDALGMKGERDLRRRMRLAVDRLTGERLTLAASIVVWFAELERRESGGTAARSLMKMAG